MANRAYEFYSFGGIDSRSNPCNMPRERSIRCRNFVPKPAGYLQLRDGYSTVTMSTVSASAIHSVFPFTLWEDLGAGVKFLAFAQSTVWKKMAIADGFITTPTVKGAAISSAAPASAYFINNRLHFGNGFDQKMFDGTTIRDNGLRSLTSSEILNVIIQDSVRELTSAERAAVTLVAAGGGSSPATSLGGQVYYVVLFDASTNELGPATQSVGIRSQVTLNQKVTVSVMPNLSGVNTNWIKLIAITQDGGNNAYFAFLSGTNMTPTALTRTSNVVTVTKTAHGRATNDIIVVNGMTPDSFNGVYKITVINANTFTYANTGSDESVTIIGSQFAQLVTAANAVTTVDVLNTSLIASSLNPIANDPTRGIPATTVGGNDAGYLFYASIYNPLTGHVSNRMALNSLSTNGRYRPTTRSNVKITALPDLSSFDTEWLKLIGRTGDGAQVPNVITDSAGNFITVANATTSTVITSSERSPVYEMPTRNGVIPSDCDKFAVVGDRIYAADSVSPTIRRSGSMLDDRTANFLGRAEQSFADNDTETFPTAEVPTCLTECDGYVFVASKANCGLILDNGRDMIWQGFWNVGAAGKRAYCKAGRHGFHWLSGNKELVAFVSGEPVPVSDEYEATLLANIPAANLSTVELVYYRDVAKAKDEIRIRYVDSLSVAREIIHDFKLADDRSPLGQAYDQAFLGALATAGPIVQIRDVNDDMQIYVGTASGQLYKHYSGGTDGGAEFTADYISLVNGGPERPNLPAIKWVGDAEALVYVGNNIGEGIADFELLSTVTEDADESLHSVKLNTPEVKHKFIRFVLVSHSADGTIALNDPPHCPLETYGVIYGIIPVVGQSRGQ